jgi:hypothetical protein
MKFTCDLGGNISTHEQQVNAVYHIGHVRLSIWGRIRERWLSLLYRIKTLLGRR